MAKHNQGMDAADIFGDIQGIRILLESDRSNIHEEIQQNCVLTSPKILVIKVNNQDSMCSFPKKKLQK